MSFLKLWMLVQLENSSASISKLTIQFKNKEQGQSLFFIFHQKSSSSHEGLLMLRTTHWLDTKNKNQDLAP